METIRTQCAGGVVLNSRGEVALVMSGPTSGNFWGFPKGHVDEGESILAGARREVSEEIGIDELTFVQELGSYERYRAQKGGGDDLAELKTIHLFLFRTSEMVLAPRDEWNPEAQWVAFDEVAGKLTHPKDREFFETVKELIQAQK